MAYKRQIDQLPIIPKDAKEFNAATRLTLGLPTSRAALRPEKTNLVLT
jgi:hypothetical protein